MTGVCPVIAVRTRQEPATFHKDVAGTTRCHGRQ